jgi:Na+-driven multidrug efflux pump
MNRAETSALWRLALPLIGAQVAQMGMLQDVTPTVSQLHGAKRLSDMGEVIR